LNKKLKYAAAAIVVLAAAIYINNTNRLAAHRDGKPVLLAHRGIAQRFDERELKNDTCTAARMLPSSHEYLENTISSMRAGFAAGADIVELDVHPTTDGEFAVFHDWTLDCRTDGQGVTREHSMAYLKKLDIGHGYTADGGKMDSRLKCNSGNKLGECLGGGFEVQAFSRGVVETPDDFGEFGFGDGIEVGFAG